MSDGQDQAKSEEATPFKLRKAREQGQVARGMDLGFVGGLVAAIAVGLIGAENYFAGLAQAMRGTLGAGLSAGRDPAEAMALIGSLYGFVLRPLVALGVVLAALLVTLEIIQLRGFIFTTKPLKPDFQRLNPAKGIKRLFSLRTLKETGKSLLKIAGYGAAAWFVIAGAIAAQTPTLTSARALAQGMARSTTQLLIVFAALAFGFMVLDQLLVRREFAKQMRMSRRDVTRETKDREGEPRLKQRRRDLHAQLRTQTEGLGKVAGSDLLVVNPDHYAVALKYDPATMAAPQVRAKGRNHFAQLMKRKARLLGVPTLPDPALARALFADCAAGEEVRPDHYRGVAALYQRLARQQAAEAPIEPQESPADVS